MREVELVEAVRSALAVLHRYLGGADTLSPAEEPARILELLKTRRARIGSAATAQLVGLNADELRLVEDCVRCLAILGTDVLTADTWVGAPRKARIAGLRFLTWMETLRERLEDLSWEAPALVAPPEETVRRQVRAVELMLRAIIEEAYTTDATLETRLRELFKDDVVDKWKKSGDKGRILTGTMFSDLASFFSNKREFGRYEALFALDGYLALFEDRRVSVQSYLDDVRRIRNMVAHNKRLSGITLLLLDAYYEELASPVARACQSGATRVSPEALLGGTIEEVDRYVAGLREDLTAVQEDLSLLHARQVRAESVVSSLGFGLALVAAGVAFFVIVHALGLLRDWDLVASGSVVGMDDRVAWYQARLVRGTLVAFAFAAAGVAHAVAGYLGRPKARSLLATVIPSVIDHGSVAPFITGWKARAVHFLVLVPLSFAYYDSGVPPSLAFATVFLLLV